MEDSPELPKPVTWHLLVWGVVCGAAASDMYGRVGAILDIIKLARCIIWSPNGRHYSKFYDFLLMCYLHGNFHCDVEDVAKSIVCMLMSGPCLTVYTQVITQIWVLLLAGLLNEWAGHDFSVVFCLAVGEPILSCTLSAQPLKMKQNGWIGNFALGANYISLPWWAGQALFGTLTPDIVVLTLLYSIAGLGIAIVNYFNSIEGDRKMGLQSLLVAFGTETVKWICVGAIDITQLSVAGYLLGSSKPYYALALLGLIIPQIVFQFQYFLKDPVKYNVQYQASAQPFLVLGLLVTALATSH